MKNVDAPETFYIQDQRQFVGNAVLWWAKDGAGYTTHLVDAWEIDKATATRIHRNRHTDKPWPAHVVRAAATMQVDAQRLPDISDAAEVAEADL